MSFLPHQVSFTLLSYKNMKKRQHKIKNETTKSNNIFIFKIMHVINQRCFLGLAMFIK